MLLTNPLERPPIYIVEQQLAGALLVVARAGRHRARATPSAGVRLIALAEHFRFVRGFRPTLTVADVRAAVENADGPAYADAVSEYAGLDRTELRVAALAALRARATAAGPG